MLHAHSLALWAELMNQDERIVVLLTVDLLKKNFFQDISQMVQVKNIH